MYAITEKGNSFRCSGGAVINPQDLPQSRAALALLLHNPHLQDQIPQEDLVYLAAQGLLEVVPCGS